MARSNIHAVSRLLSISPMPVYLLDEQRIIQYCNPACCQWTGHEEPQLVGVRCDYHTAPDGNDVMRIAAGLCPPPDVFHGRSAIAIVGLRQPGGQFSQREARFLPFLAADGAVESVLAIVDSTDRAASGSDPAVSESESSEQLHARLRKLRNELGNQYRIEQLVGETPETHRMREQVRAAAASAGNVCVVGTPGSGREHLARAIHYARSSGDTPLIPVDCAVANVELLQSALQSLQHGLDAAPDTTATLLLLDLDQLEGAAQADLLRWLLPHRPSLAVLATVSQPLIPLARSGRFSLELACVLAIITIDVPALAERRADIRLLAQLFLEQQNQGGRRQWSGFAADALGLLESYPWPRQIEELAEVIAEACGQAQGTLVTRADLPEPIRAWGQASNRVARPVTPIVLDDFLAEIQRELVAQSLSRTRNNRTRAAELLGISRARLLRLVEQFGLQPAPRNWDPRMEPENSDPEESIPEE